MGKKKAYEEAGVSIELGNRFVEEIQRHLRRTYGPRVVDVPEGFAGLFRIDYDRKLFARNYKDPVLVACTDGVGTKLKVARMMKKHDTVGIDLVAMSVNDLIVQGAEPLFFLDYVATGKVDLAVLCDVVKGIADGCVEAECALLGGETAEHPGDFDEGEYDLAGFCVGVVERSRITSIRGTELGDVVIGLASNGLHSNGFSLVRKVFFEKAGMSVSDRVEELGGTLGRELLKPTRIYARPVLSALNYYRVKDVIHGIAHITGGGLVGNIPRVLGAGHAVRIRKGSWPVPPIFGLVQKLGKVDEEEMAEVFNMGIGMVLIVSPYYAGAVMRRIRRFGVEPYVIGEVVRGKGSVTIK
ncbi:MAG TPA: phosphoribosylformylglycinamidine cyclo-ligase, partial [Planctomycetota bacterium]|nr:phosphoribosylformylglycinamidine cyclo-ligase [Planctomycetota bacterium]